MQRIDIREASRRTGLSVSALRRGCRAGRFAHIRVGSERGKILFDPAVLQLQLRNEEMASTYAAEITVTADSWDEPAGAAENKSLLAGLFVGHGEDDKVLTLADKRIEASIVEVKAKLFVIDPLQAFLGDAGMNSAGGVRPLMKSLGAVAERTGCAIVIIGHLNKSGGAKAAYRGLGSVDIIAAARSVLTVGRADAEGHTRAFVQTKNNLAPIGKPQAFELSPTDGFNWLGDIDITIDDLLSNKKESSESLFDKACRLIASELSNGSALAVDVKQAITNQGISLKTFNAPKKTSVLYPLSVDVNGIGFYRVMRAMMRKAGKIVTKIAKIAKIVICQV